MRIKVLSGGRKNIELSLSDAELNFQMRRIGIEETVPMCRLVEVSEKDNPLHRFEGQTVNMDEVNFFAKRMESLTEYERKVLSAYAEDYGVATMKDLINLTFSMKGLSLLTDFSDARQVGVRLYMDEFLGMSEEEKEQKLLPDHTVRDPVVTCRMILLKCHIFTLYKIRHAWIPFAVFSECMAIDTSALYLSAADTGRRYD